MAFVTYDFYTIPGSSDEKVRHWSHQLYREFDNICYQYGVSLRRPMINIDDSKGRWGMWDGATRLLSISRQLIESYRWDAVIDVLKHEMAHMVVGEVFMNPSHLHDAPFARACRVFGIAPWACASEEQMAHFFQKHENERENPTDDRLTQKVKKLLALATSSNEHEALLAIQRVKEIYARHNLSQIASEKQSKFVYTIINHRQKRIPQYQSTIASMLASHFFVEVIHTHLFDAATHTNHKVLEILGTIDNVKMAEYIYYYLFNNLPLLWNAYKRVHATGSLRSKNSYYLGVLLGFRHKLDDEAASPAKEGGPLADGPLVTASGEIIAIEHIPEERRRHLMHAAKRELDAFVRTRFPRLSSRSAARCYTDPTTFDAGVRQGRQLSLNRGITQHEKGHVPLLKGK